MSRYRKLCLFLALPAVGLAGCGTSATASGGAATTVTTSAASTSGTAATSTTGAAATTTAPSVSSTAGSPTTGTRAGAQAIAAIPKADQSPAGTAGKAPTVVVPPGSPPKQLEMADLIVGKGPAAEDGDTVSVEYVLATYSSRRVIQSSWTSQPFQFTLGEGQVIAGWDKGVVGMRAGGRRELIIPPSLGYGPTSPGAGIAPDDTLVFVVDLLKIG